MQAICKNPNYFASAYFASTNKLTLVHSFLGLRLNLESEQQRS